MRLTHISDRLKTLCTGLYRERSQRTAVLDRLRRKRRLVQDIPRPGG